METPLPVTAIRNNDLCVVCGSDGARIHYNALTCGRCRVFFIRYAKSLGLPLVCMKGGNCNVTREGGEKCAACRFKKCLDNGMNPEEVGLNRRFPNSMTFISKGVASRAMMKLHLPVTVNYNNAEFKLKARIESAKLLQKWRKADSPNEIKDGFEGNLSLTLRELLNLSQIKPMNYFHFDNSLDDNKDKELYGWRHYRMILAFVNFLRTSDYFTCLDIYEQERLAQHNFVDFILLTMAYIKWEQNISSTEYVEMRKKSLLTGADSTFGDYHRSMFLEMMTNDIEPRLKGLKPDCFEFSLVKMIAMFSSPVGITFDVSQQINFAKETYAIGLGNYVQFAHPDLTHDEHFLRVKSLLEIVSIVKSTATRIAPFYSQCVVLDYGGMRGNLTFDLHLRSY